MANPSEIFFDHPPSSDELDERFRVVISDLRDLEGRSVTSTKQVRDDIRVLSLKVDGLQAQMDQLTTLLRKVAL